MKDLEQRLKQNNSRIISLKKKIKDNLKEIHDLTIESAILLSTYKNQTKSYFSRSIAKLFKCKTVGEANEAIRSYKLIAKKEKVDRIFLEELNVIEKPQRKNSQRKIDNKPDVLQIGELIGRLRHMNEKGLSITSKSIAKEMLKQLEKEL